MQKRTELYCDTAEEYRRRYGNLAPKATCKVGLCPSLEVAVRDSFLAWGDYMIPFEWATYWAKHFYMWSFQSGTPNPDGLIRLPGRTLNFIVFGLTDNVGLGYFYLIAPLVLAFIAFFLFARKFLQIKDTSVLIIGALFFALNPVFLGNMAKVGLVMAAALLPLCLLAIRATFMQKRFRYLLLYIVCLNISFLHPYTFTVNVAVSGAYFLWMAWQHRSWALDVWPKFIMIGILAVAVNAYFLLPMASMGTVSKDVISTNITPVAVDYTALVGVSNTGDIFTGFSLSKNVFVDFAFYNSTYQNVYFFGVFLFYVLLFGLYLVAERSLTRTDKRRLGIYFGGFLVLLLLAATTVAHIDKLITFLIHMPGGWAFRSPLKWQLYIPLALFSVLVLLLNRVPNGQKRMLFQSGLLVTFVLMNAYLFIDLHHKILTPRSPEYFASLAERNMDGKTVLFVNNGECMDFMRTYPRITTEMNQIFNSKHTQLKHVLEDSIDAVNLASYDYVLTCHGNIDPLLDTFRFEQIDKFADNTFHLYANRHAEAAVSTADTLYQPQTKTGAVNKYSFVTNELDGRFNFARGGEYPTTKLADVFEHLTPANIQPGAITAHDVAGHRLHLNGDDELHYRLTDDTILLSPTPGPDFEPLQDGAVELNPSVRYDVSYVEPSIEPQNVVPNSSFEQGLWQGVVGDCYAYDDKPEIGMRLVTGDKTAGSQSLELWARSHVACTGPEPIAVTPGEHYLLTFDYNDLDGGKFAGYYVSFDDPDETVLTERIQNDGNGWQTFSKGLAVPDGATSMRLMLYAFPDSYSERTRHVRYDQVSLMPIPPVQNRLYAIGEPNVELQKPQALTYKANSPTRTTVQIQGANKPFYLQTKETYHDLWQAELVGTGPRVQLPFIARDSVPAANHIQLNGTMNAWYIDPAALCEGNRSCVKHDDGSYSFTLALNFTPQGWFYFGAVVSASAALAGAAYFIYDRRRNGPGEEGKWRWRK